MIVLALDTALEACSVAVGRGPALLAQDYAECGRAHAERLVPMIARVLGLAALKPQEIARIGVTVGPGSFTGLRTGLAAARGLALALGCPAIGITTTAAIAAAMRAPARDVRPQAVAIEARRGEIYLAAYDGEGRETIAPCALALAAAVPLLSAEARRWRLGGSAASELADALAQAGVEASVADGAKWPDAAHMLALVASAAPQASPPRPLYLRAADARPMTERGT